jgi:hypothetical protein
MISLGRTLDGRLVLGSNQSFPAAVKYVEYYRDQKLMNLVFDTEDEETALMPNEADDHTAQIIHSSPNIMVIAMAEMGQNPYGYTVPLVQIGI